jgi:two-component system repressor protein LuxO
MLPADLEEVQVPEALDEPVEDVGASASPAESPVIFPLAELEKRAIEHALRVCDGSATEAARLLGVSPATVYRKVKSFGILLPSS